MLINACWTTLNCTTSILLLFQKSFHVQTKVTCALSMPDVGTISLCLNITVCVNLDLLVMETNAKVSFAVMWIMWQLTTALKFDLVGKIINIFTSVHNC